MPARRLKRALEAGKRLDERTGAYLVGELFWIVGPFIALAWLVLGSVSLVRSLQHGSGEDVRVAAVATIVGAIVWCVGVHRWWHRRRSRRAGDSTATARWDRLRDPDRS